MAQLVLTKSLTFSYKGRVYRRGVPVEITDSDVYAALVKNGFRNPDQDLTDVHPTQLGLAPAGSEVLVIREGGMGDVLMVLPGLRDLAHRWPKLRFTYVTAPHLFPLLRDADFLYRSTTIESIRGRWKWTIDLRGHTEKHGHEREYRVDCFSRYLNRRPATSADYPLKVKAEDLARGQRLVGTKEPVLAFVVGSVSQAGMRDWPESYNDRLCRLARAAGFRVALVDSRPHATTQAQREAGVLNYTGRLSIPDLVGLIAVSEVVVTPDTGVLHLAEALDKRTVCYFTTVPPEARSAKYTWTRGLYAGVPCAPCYHRPTCGLPAQSTICAKAVSPERVFEEVEWILDHDPPFHFRAPFHGPARVEFHPREEALTA